MAPSLVASDTLNFPGTSRQGQAPCTHPHATQQHRSIWEITGRWLTDGRERRLTRGKHTSVSRCHCRPNHNVAMPRKEKKPTTSVTVVTKGPEDTAGSTP